MPNAEFHFGNRYTGTFGWFITSGTAIPCCIRDGSGDRQFQWRPTKRRIYRELLLLAVAESTARRPIHRIHTLQWRLNQLRRRGPQRQRQQYVYLDAKFVF